MLEPTHKDFNPNLTRWSNFISKEEYSDYPPVI